MKNAIYKIINSIRQRFVKPKVYAIVLKVKGFQNLSVQSAYSLEEAYAKAKMSISNERIPTITADDINLSKIDMFHHMEIDDLFADFIETEIAEEIVTPELSVLEKKNLLMKLIIDSKDLKLLEENRSIFSESEVKYLTTEINKK